MCNFIKNKAVKPLVERGVALSVMGGSKIYIYIYP
jgi:hypothetical protein